MSNQAFNRENNKKHNVQEDAPGLLRVRRGTIVAPLTADSLFTDVRSGGSMLIGPGEVVVNGFFWGDNITETGTSTVMEVRAYENADLSGSSTLFVDAANIATLQSGAALDTNLLTIFTNAYVGLNFDATSIDTGTINVTLQTFKYN
jgi:hypothetical protein